MATDEREIVATDGYGNVLDDTRTARGGAVLGKAEGAPDMVTSRAVHSNDGITIGNIVDE